MGASGQAWGSASADFERTCVQPVNITAAATPDAAPQLRTLERSSPLCVLRTHDGSSWRPLHELHYEPCLRLYATYQHVVGKCVR